ncbi:MAG TPA: thiamine phosphate synthase, partial [Burkholderiaceae bacterium]|nr:thiamine phosphate synthase [Burkholderiaceae bacterium]
MLITGLYAITPDTTDTDWLAERVAAVLAGGARALQYRNKLADAALRLQQATRLKPLAERHRVPLIVNDDVELALRIGADGVHVGADPQRELDVIVDYQRHPV